MSRLVIAISNHAFRMGGGEYSFQDFLSRLPKDWKPLMIFPGAGTWKRKFHDAGIKVKLIPLPPIRPWTVPAMIRSLIQFLKLFSGNVKPDLIYANGSRAAFYGGICGRLLKIPVIWHCRIAQSEFYFDFLLALLCRRIIVNSRFTAERFHPVFKPKVRIVYNGLDIEWLKKTPLPKPDELDSDWKNILVVARFSKSKHHDFILDTFAKMNASGSDYHLIFLGQNDIHDPEFKKYLAVKIKRSHWKDRIHMFDAVDDPRPWYRHSHLLLSASENESFGRIFVEAMACGLPVIAARSGAVREIIRDGQDGLLFTPLDQKSLIRAVNRVSSDPALREKLVRSASARAEIFNLDTHIAAMVEIFKTLVAE